MDFRAWHIDLNAKTAHHPSGFQLIVEGDPREPSGVIPKRFPRELSAADQAMLLRLGLQAMMRAADSKMAA